MTSPGSKESLSGLSIKGMNLINNPRENKPSSPYGPIVYASLSLILLMMSGITIVSAVSVLTNISVGRSPVDIAINQGTNRIYVTNWAANSISVINGNTNAVIKTIKKNVGSKPFTPVYNPNNGRLYITNEGNHTVSVLDTNTDNIIGSILVGRNAAGADLNPNTNLLYVTVYFEDAIAVIDMNSNQVI